jgi:uncharacterized protein YggT (Ycf19 family)
VRSAISEQYPRPPRTAMLGPLGRIIDFVFGLIYTALLVRFILELLGARPSTGFFELILKVSDPFYAPFRGLFPATTFESERIVWSLLAAVFGYALLHGLLRGLLRIFLHE